ncbi:Uncharacterized protein FKW44_022818 [Caligus rogercresseyi]|uniref:Uncharacterized protein n=1 Tax=Caligus rogercresseyi TaxID=217165 RepID=A0A7T8GNM3_CALRO|nr:Uncharacterized protein FKW44_022818 [Caligus rogercresseyi]
MYQGGPPLQLLQAPKGPDLDREGAAERLSKAQKLLNKLKHPVHNDTLWFFSDEKNSTQDQKHNSQNNRCPSSARPVPGRRLVFGIISSNGDVMPPHFFPKGLRLNSEGYVALMKDVVAPWIKKVAAGRPYVSGWPRTWTTTTGPNIWAPNSPDCNLCDYYLWGAVEQDTNRTSCNIMAECFKKLPRDQVRSACARFRSQLEQVVEVRGAYFE